jgi:hypothetical protein
MTRKITLDISDETYKLLQRSLEYQNKKYIGHPFTIERLMLDHMIHSINIEEDETDYYRKSIEYVDMNERLFESDWSQRARNNKIEP